jgi:hypothetical protein
MICTWPGCTGVHDNNRYGELCPRSRSLKAQKDARYQWQGKVQLRRYLLALDRRRGAQLEALGVGDLDADDDVHRANTERFLSRPKRSRPKLAPICTRPISVAQILLDTANPARSLR